MNKGFTENKWKLQRCKSRFKRLYIISTKTGKIEKQPDQERRFGPLGSITCGKVIREYTRETKGRGKASLVSLSMQTHPISDSLCPVMKTALVLKRREGNFMFFFYAKKKGGQRVLLISYCFSTAFAQNKQYVKATYFWVMLWSFERNNEKEKNFHILLKWPLKALTVLCFHLCQV